MYIRYMSDLHLEFGDIGMVPEMPEDKDTVLILAGDVGLAEKAFTYQYFVVEMADQFKEVIYILGNHEYYKSSFVRAFNKIDEMFAGYNNVTVTNDNTIIIDGVAFVCSTLWADFQDGNPLVMNAAQMQMNDYRIIRTGPNKDNAYARKLSPQDTFIAHKKSVDYIFPAIVEQKEKGNKVVVVTHHGPSYQSVHEHYRSSDLNGAYVSNLDEKILDTAPSFWIHGHTHVSLDYNIGDTQVLCNPRGYYNVELNPDFDLSARFEV